jgi:hypothetical protein
MFDKSVYGKLLEKSLANCPSRFDFPFTAGQTVLQALKISHVFPE